MLPGRLPARAASWVFPVLWLDAPAWADHGGPLAAAPMSPLVVALLAGGLAVVTVLLLVAIWRLIARPGRDAE